MGIVEQLGAHKPYTAPVPITLDHRLDGFTCGKPALDDWLKAHAVENEGKASRTYVATARVGEQAGCVIAYYTLAYGSVTRTELPRKMRHGLPNPVPMMVLGRLAVDNRHGGHGLGPGLLREALTRTAHASQIGGLRALIVHAIDDDAMGFYVKYGFQHLPGSARTLLLPIETIRESIKP